VTAQTTHHFQCKTCASFNIYGFLNIIKNYKYLRSPITLKKKSFSGHKFILAIFFLRYKTLSSILFFIYYRTQFSLTLYFSAIIDASIEQSLIYFQEYSNPSMKPSSHVLARIAWKSQFLSEVMSCLCVAWDC
jgi:hypothetical protein